MVADLSLADLRNDPALHRLGALEAQARSLAGQTGLSPKHYPVLADSWRVSQAISRASAETSVMVIGQVSTGKSSLINSLFGDRIFMPSDEPTDGVISVLCAAGPGENAPRGERVRRDGKLEPFPSWEAALAFLRQQRTQVADQIDTLEVRLYHPDPWLQRIRVINTPGLGDRLAVFHNTTLQYLNQNESDLVIWTFFPEVAANTAELTIFDQALSRRQGSVLGVVTHSLSGHEDDPDYNPWEDPSLLSVVNTLKKRLGRYLADVILYDSHATRLLIRQIRTNPALESDPAMVAALERTGYIALKTHLDRYALPGAGPDVRAAAILNRCAGHATNLAQVAQGCMSEAERKSGAGRQRLEAWRKVERDVLRPAKEQLKEALGTLSDQTASELVHLMGQGASDAIMAHFTLVGSIFRSLGSKVRLCDSAVEHLNKHIARYIDDAVQSASVLTRLQENARRTIVDHVQMLEQDIISYTGELQAPGLKDGPFKDLKVDAHRPGGDVQKTMGDVLGPALRTVIGGVLEQLAKKLGEEVVEETAEQAGKQLIKKMVEKGVQEGTKQAGMKAAGALAARIASIVTIAMVPLDIHKLITDFGEGRDRAADSVRKRYESEKSVRARQMFDVLWPAADELFNQILQAARHSAAGDGETWELLRSEADACAEALLEVSRNLEGRAKA